VVQRCGRGAERDGRCARRKLFRLLESPSAVAAVEGALFRHGTRTKQGDKQRKKREKRECVGAKAKSNVPWRFTVSDAYIARLPRITPERQRPARCAMH